VGLLEALAHVSHPTRRLLVMTDKATNRLLRE